MFLFLFLGQDMETDTEVNRRSIYDRLDDLAQSPPPVFESSKTKRRARRIHTEEAKSRGTTTRRKNKRHADDSKTGGAEETHTHPAKSTGNVRNLADSCENL